MKTTSAKTDLLTTLAESFLEQLRRGERPNTDDYTARHPELATEIRELFATLRLVDELGEQPQFGGNQPLPAAATIPSLLGDFQLTREIARGGMGIVYEALQSSLGRRVAVKVLPPTEVADVSRRLRFQREARAAANLHHTNIVPVFEVGEQDGICFYAMQFIEGETLADVWRELRRMRSDEAVGSTDVAEGDPTLAHSICQVLYTTPQAIESAGGQQADSAPASIATPDTRQRPTTHEPPRYAGPSGVQTIVTSRGGPRSSASHWTLHGRPSRRQYFDNVAGIVLQMVDALAYAHAQGVLHRDIKPSNVILDTQCRAWLTDFGLAKVGGDDLTAESHVVGTLRYMSPERFAGQVDARSDVYSAGLILYELITLRPAFEALDHAGMMHLIQHARPIRPRECEPAVPKDLETIVLCAIDKDPARRYQSAAALVTDLGRYLEGRPLLARRASRWEHTWRWCWRNPVVSVLAAALCCVILGAWITTFCLWRCAEASHAQAKANLELSQSNLELAVDAVDQFGAKVSEDLRLKQQDLRPLRRDLLQTAVDFQQKLLDRRGNSDLARIDLARSYHRLAKLTAEIDAHHRAVSLYQQALGQYESLLVEDPDNKAIQYELSLNLGELAHLWIDTGHSAEAQAALDRGITMLKSLLNLAPDPSRVRSQLAFQLGLKAYVLSMTRRFEESQAIWHDAIAHHEQLRSSHPDQVSYVTDLAHAHAKMAEAILGAGIVNWREAKAELQTALTLQRDAVTHADASNGDWLILAAVLRDLANIEKISGDAAAGATRFQEAIEVLERLMREQPSVLTNIEGAASCYFQLGTCYAVANQPDRIGRRPFEHRLAFGNDWSPKCPAMRCGNPITHGPCSARVAWRWTMVIWKRH